MLRINRVEVNSLNVVGQVIHRALKNSIDVALFVLSLAPHGVSQPHTENESSDLVRLQLRELRGRPHGLLRKAARLNLLIPLTAIESAKLVLTSDVLTPLQLAAALQMSTSPAVISELRATASALKAEKARLQAELSVEKAETEATQKTFTYIVRQLSVENVSTIYIDDIAADNVARADLCTFGTQTRSFAQQMGRFANHILEMCNVEGEIIINCCLNPYPSNLL